MDKCKEEWDTFTEDERLEYSRNVYYPYNSKFDNLDKHENIEDTNYITICFDYYKGKGDKKEKAGVKKITFAHPVNIGEFDNDADQTKSKRGIMPKILRKLLKFTTRF